MLNMDECSDILKDFIESILSIKICTIVQRPFIDECDKTRNLQCKSN